MKVLGIILNPQNPNPNPKSKSEQVVGISIPTGYQNLCLQEAVMSSRGAQQALVPGRMVITLDQRSGLPEVGVICGTPSTPAGGGVSGLASKSSAGFGALQPGTAPVGGLDSQTEPYAVGTILANPPHPLTPHLTLHPLSPHTSMPHLTHFHPSPLPYPALLPLTFPCRLPRPSNPRE